MGMVSKSEKQLTVMTYTVATQDISRGKKDRIDKSTGNVQRVRWRHTSADYDK